MAKAKKTKIETAALPEEIMEAAVPEKVMATVKGGKKLNIRADESLDAEIVGTLDDGSEIEIIRKGKEWSEIAGGFVMTKFLAF